MKTKILTYLKEADGYVSGQQLCEKLSVSRTAVWKVIRRLQDEGYQIEAVRNRGYHLVECGDIYTAAELESVIETTSAGKTVVFLDQVDSTNTRAKLLAEQGAPEGTLVVAKTQTMGKGRRGRTWESPMEGGIWMSLLLRPKIAPISASMLTLVSAMAVTRGIREITGLNSQIKWPNDVVVKGKKVCGILTEMSAELDFINHVVIGIGINVNIETFPEPISQMATSLLLEGGHLFHRASLIGAVLKSWEGYYERFLETENLSRLSEEYNQLLVNWEKEVKVLAPEGDYMGISHGINSGGELLVEREDGNVTQVISGEVSVRGVYGYA